MLQKLDRTLGLYSCITISAGTMIGSAIFVLAGTSYQTAGPSASLSVFLAGIAAIFTALSFAEIVTFIPRAGGGYAYVREATNNGILSFITGWGFWLGYAMSCGLFALGFGNFLNYFFPFIPRMFGAYLLILYVTFINIRGMQNSSKLQNIITTALLLLLFIYIFYGAFYVDLSKQRPFFTQEMTGMLKAMGFLYITYIGYGLITTASEEVINPEKTIPKAIIISLLIVIFIKTSVFFVGSGIIHWENLLPSVTNTPLIDTAIKISGQIGGYLFAFAGILATVSSINTAMMASSRTSFAMSRDRRLPNIFKNINKHTKTPIFSVIFSAVIVIISTSLNDLEKISTITSIFSLIGYSFVNIALIVFRRKLPNAKRHFKVPLYPITPVLGVIVNIFLVIQLMKTDKLSLILAFVIVSIGILYFYLVLPKLKEASLGIHTSIIPEIQFKNSVNKSNNYKVLVPLGDPNNIETLLSLGSQIANSNNGKLIPLHVINIPEVIPIDSGYNETKEELEKYQNTIESIKKFDQNCSCLVETLAIISRDIVHAIKSSVIETDSNLVLIGWSKAKFSNKMLGSIPHKILESVPRTVAIFKKGNNKEIKKILYPYGGGYHSQVTIEIIKKLLHNNSNNIEITFLRISELNTSLENKKEMEDILKKGLLDINLIGKIKIVENNSIVDAIVTESLEHDLVILGASSEWGIKNYFMGSVVDDVLNRITCSGLVIRGHHAFSKRKNIRNIFNKFKKNLID